MRKYKESYDSIDGAYTSLVNNCNIFQSNNINSPDLEIKNIQEAKDIVKVICGEEINSPKELFKRVPFQRLLDYKISQKTEVYSGKIWFFALRSVISEKPLDYCCKDIFERIICDDLYKKKRIVATLETSGKLHNTDCLLNDFIKLDLKDRRRNGRNTIYPDNNEIGRIKKFIEKYGLDFIQYPHQDRNDFNYFEEFNLQYQWFKTCYKKVIENHLLEKIELLHTNYFLNQIKDNIGTFKITKKNNVVTVNIIKPRVVYKILYCYDRLRKILLSKQPAKKCKGCDSYFSPSRRNNYYHSEACRARAKQARHFKRTRPN